MSEISPATGKLLALSMLKGIGPATLRKIAGMLDFEKIDNDRIATQFPSNATVLRDENAWSYALVEAEKQIEEAEKHGAKILSPLDPEYPTLLAATKNDPFLLFVRGNLAPTPAKSVAIIGTRAPTSHGTIVTQRITHYFVEQGWSVVSGLAIRLQPAHRLAFNSRIPHHTCIPHYSCMTMQQHLGEVLPHISPTLIVPPGHPLLYKGREASARPCT